MVCVPTVSKKRCVPVICPNCTQINFSVVYPETVPHLCLGYASTCFASTVPKSALLDSQITLFSYIGRTVIVKEIQSTYCYKKLTL